MRDNAFNIILYKKIVSDSSRRQCYLLPERIGFNLFVSLKVHSCDLRFFDDYEYKIYTALKGLQFNLDIIKISKRIETADVILDTFLREWGPGPACYFREDCFFFYFPVSPNLGVFDNRHVIFRVHGVPCAQRKKKYHANKENREKGFLQQAGTVL